MNSKLQIIDLHLDFAGLTPRAHTTRLVVHHSASPDVSAAEIHRWHLERGFSGIGYHYLIRANGSIELGRPADMTGAHTQGCNGDSIGICLAGDFDMAVPSRAQLSALTRLVLELSGHYGPLVVCRHSDLNPTHCPGTLFPWIDLCRELYRLSPALDQSTWKAALVEKSRRAGLISGEHEPDEAAPKWFVLAVALQLRDSLRN